MHLLLSRPYSRFATEPSLCLNSPGHLAGKRVAFGKRFLTEDMLARSDELHCRWMVDPVWSDVGDRIELAPEDCCIQTAECLRYVVHGTEMLHPILA